MADFDLSPWGYSKLGCIGKGQFGSAFTVQGADKDGQPPPVQVCKIVSLELLNDHDQKLALQEVELLRRLSHPSIVGYHLSFLAKQDGDRPPVLCIIMDYCDGGDLRQAIKRQKSSNNLFQEQQVMRWFTQLTQAIAHIHQNKIIHRDLKTSNIFLSNDGDVKLADFGISRVLEATAAAANTLLGTPYYMAPEVCQSEPYELSSDVWALGCVLYEMCALKHAFQAASLVDLVQKICRGEPDPLPNIYSPGLNQLLKRLLAKSAKDRPRAADVLEEPLIKAMTAAPTMAARSLRPRGAGSAPAPPQQTPPEPDSPEMKTCIGADDTAYFSPNASLKS